ncbi:CsbD family protein [Actinophytocola sp.]|uniref:CsbD family protein n=1 Tax=Actinophytocola sp. TaxID=1872138 RepID=UPI003D6B81D7
MNMFDKAKARAERLVGEAKERMGHKTGDEDLENAGKRDKLTGEAKVTGHGLRDKAAAALRDAKERLRGR